MSQDLQILLVEDDDRFTKVIRSLLHEAGHDAVTTVASIEAARAHFANSTCDVVLLDLHLPDGDGIELVPTIRAKASHARVVVITSTRQDRFHADAQVGFDGYLYKEELAGGRLDLAIRGVVAGIPPVSWRALQQLAVPAANGTAVPMRGGPDPTIAPSGPAPQGRVGPGIGATRGQRRGDARPKVPNLALGYPTPVTLELGPSRITIADQAVKEAFERMGRLAPSELPVLICGETGVGKEGAARAVHDWSGRAGPFVAINCGAIPESMAESELFGHCRGAFTGAGREKEGLFEAAAGGTLFLDEVGELPLVIQSKLLRAIDNMRVMRLGETSERRIDVRIVAATNRSLDDEVAAGRFRQDLRFRLCGASVYLPPLRDRPYELGVLAHELLKDECAKVPRTSASISPEAMLTLRSYQWPGNVRELKSAMALIAIEVRGDRVEPTDVQQCFRRTLPVERPLPGLARREGSGEDAIPDKCQERPRDVGGTYHQLWEEWMQNLERLMKWGLRATNGNKAQAAVLIRMPLRTFTLYVKRFGM